MTAPTNVDGIANTTDASASSTVTESQSTSALPSISVIASPLVTSKTSSVYSNSEQVESTNVLFPSSTGQPTKANGDSNSSTVAINVSSATSTEASSPSAQLLPSTSLQSSVTLNQSLGFNSSLTIPKTSSMEPATSTNVSVAKAATSLSSHSGLLTTPTQFMTANYSLSLASRRGSIVSTTVEPNNTLTTSLPGIDQ